MAPTRGSGQGPRPDVTKQVILPNEVLLAIFPHLRPEIWGDSEVNQILQHTLSSITRTSKRFQQLALPELYHTIPNFSPKLLLTLLDNADRAKLVRAIALDDMYCHSGNVFQPALRDAAWTICGRLSLSPASKMRVLYAINGLDYDGRCILALSLLAYLLPNMAVASAPIMLGCENDAIHDFFTKAFSLPRIERLSEVWIKYLSEGHLQPTDPLYRIISTVESLQIETLSECIFDIRSSDPLPQLLLKHMKIRRFDLEDQFLLNYLLSSYPSLQTLHIGGWWGGSDLSEYDPQLSVSLQTHTPQLEELSLTCITHTDELCGCECEDICGPLRNLTRLKTLTVSPILLFRRRSKVTLSDVLPDSLESLVLLCRHHLDECLDDPEAQICSLIQDKDRFTKLHCIELRGKKHFQKNAAALGWSIYHKEVQNDHTVVLTKAVSHL